MQYESKQYALEERGVRRMANKCEHPSVWVTAFKMRVQDFATECVGGRRSVGKTSRNEVTSRRVQSISILSIILFAMLRENSTRTEFLY